MDQDRPVKDCSSGTPGNPPNYPHISYKPFHPVDQQEKESFNLQANGTGTVLSDPSSSKNESNQITISVTSQNGSQMHRKCTKKKKRNVRIFLICTILALFLLSIIIFSLLYFTLIQNSDKKDGLLWGKQPYLSETIQIPEVHFPSNYFVELYIDLLQPQADDNYCEGTVQITFDTRVAADFILLHSGPRQKVGIGKLHKGN